MSEAQKNATQQPFAPVDTRPDFPAMEQRVQKYWEENQSFKKSVELRPKDRQFVFYDGPPFATGLPHYGHLLQGTVKDLIPRYKTMRGFRVERRFGWDCHGLPIELEIEQNLGLKGRPDILEFGVDKYNEECRATVLKYTHEWRVVCERMGRWIDFDNDYKTMDASFMESVWNVFKRMWDQGLIYEGRKILPYSWRLSTPLSNSEASLNYLDTQDPSVTVRMRLKDEDASFLVWTTTPWTLPSNLAVCVGPKIEYAKIKVHETNEVLILAQSRLESYFKPDTYSVLETKLGSDLKGIAYSSLFDYASAKMDTSNCFVVLVDDYVSDDSGTGIVHQAPGFGEDDLRVCQNAGIAVFDPIDAEGNFFAGLDLIGGMNFKEADKVISKSLKDRGLMFRQETLNHSYPFCWRTDTPLMYRAISSWFVSIDSIKEKLLKNAEGIHWVPDHIREGRFGNWLANARDWAISRNRFWGTPLPIWENEDGERICFGSIAELEAATGQKVPDIHKHFVDSLTFNKDGKTYKRIPEVLDCWFESGSMPYGQQHYPFENKEVFESNFPADFICEAIDQTRCWFYYLHVIGTALFDQPAFKNVICTGLILASDGKKLSKRHKNYTPPMDVFNIYGADAMRYFLVTSPVVKGLEVRVADSEFKEVVKSVILPLWNVFSFFVSYANIDGYHPSGKMDSKNQLDRYILSEYQILLRNVTASMDNYDLAESARYIQKFLPTLSNWYLRRSRRRFWAEGLEADKVSAYETLYAVLLGLCKILCPIMPFVTEHIYRHLTGAESVHLTDWDEIREDLIDETLSQRMDQIRSIVTLGHSLRAKNKIKVRRPLKEIRVAGVSSDLLSEYQDLIGEELNVKASSFVADGSELGKSTMKLNFKTLGARLGKQMQQIAKAAKDGDFSLHEDHAIVGGVRIEPTDYEIVYAAVEGFDCASESGIVVALDLEIDEMLELEGQAREILRHIQNLRKEANYNLTDRITAIVCTKGLDSAKIETHFGPMIASEALAKSLIFGEIPATVDAQTTVEIDEETGFAVGVIKA
ncbi:MAG: isoleucine--tRNA ligase [Candidatus Cloacimonetes bacterium]|nr:isoleucine--tRNA ligase [Candidatus Cloacimonadota bacterium]